MSGCRTALLVGLTVAGGASMACCGGCLGALNSVGNALGEATEEAARLDRIEPEEVVSIQKPSEITCDVETFERGSKLTCLKSSEGAPQSPVLTLEIDRGRIDVRMWYEAWDEANLAGVSAREAHFQVVPTESFPQLSINEIPHALGLERGKGGARQIVSTPEPQNHPPAAWLCEPLQGSESDRYTASCAGPARYEISIFPYFRALEMRWDTPSRREPDLKLGLHTSEGLSPQWIISSHPGGLEDPSYESVLKL